MILSWLVDKDVANKALREGVLIDEDQVECMPDRVPNSIADENVDIFLVRPLFTQDAWALVEDVYRQKIRKMAWICDTCYRDLDTEESIACDSCLLWQHFKCAGLLTRPKTKTWFCRKCYARAKQSDSH